MPTTVPTGPLAGLRLPLSVVVLIKPSVKCYKLMICSLHLEGKPLYQSEACDVLPLRCLQRRKPTAREVDGVGRRAFVFADRPSRSHAPRARPSRSTLHSSAWRCHGAPGLRGS
jgi:hypothetical protein